jgi:hypothetical protein
VIELGHDTLPLDAASRICNSELLSKGDQASAARIFPWQRILRGRRRSPPAFRPPPAATAAEPFLACS